MRHPQGNTLVIDKGNSSAKAVVFSPKDEILLSERLPEAGLDILDRIIVDWSPRKAILCCVGHLDQRDAESLRMMMDGRLLVLTHRTPLPIAVDYLTPATLGLDRIAAAAGAAALFPGQPLLIADAGTALTLDLVDASGRFRGGNISPGVALRLRALHDFTEALPRVAAEGELPRFGNSTDTAIRAGVIHGLVGEIRASLEAAADTCGPARLILTGGDAPLLLPLLSQASHEPQLVSIGLKRILDYNENN